MSGRYWRTPPDLYAKLDAEFGFDFDPCPYPRPEDFNRKGNPVVVNWDRAYFGQSGQGNPTSRQTSYRHPKRWCVCGHGRVWHTGEQGECEISKWYKPPQTSGPLFCDCATYQQIDP